MSKPFIDSGALEADARRAADVELRRRREAGEPVSALVTETAAKLGCSTRTVWRLLDGPTASPTHRPETAALPEAWRVGYLSWGGNTAALWRELEAAGGAGVSLRQLQRRLAAGLTAAERACARGGNDARRSHGLYLRYEAEHRNAVWQADHKQLDVLVAHPTRPTRTVQPWVTWAIDDYSRAVMGWAISIQPSSAEVLAALRAAMLEDTAGGVLRGVPGRLRMDRGLEFLAGAIGQACAALNIELDVCDAYTPQQKGKVERLHRTLIDTLLVGLPHFTGGPRAANGKLEDSGPPLTLDRLVERFATWVGDYNARPHEAHDRRAPLTVFGEDPTPLTPLSAETARALLVKRWRARVRADGITHRRIPYTAPELAELVGEWVQVAGAPHDQRSLDVYWRGEYRCTVLPQHELAPAQRAAVLTARHEHAAELRRQQRAARRAAAQRIAPITAPGQAVAEVTTLPEAELRTQTRSGRERVLRSAARVDLLLGVEETR